MSVQFSSPLEKYVWQKSRVLELFEAMKESSKFCVDKLCWQYEDQVKSLVKASKSNPQLASCVKEAFVAIRENLNKGHGDFLKLKSRSISHCYIDQLGSDDSLLSKQIDDLIRGYQGVFANASIEKKESAKNGQLKTVIVKADDKDINAMKEILFDEAKKQIGSALRGDLKDVKIVKRMPTGKHEAKRIRIETPEPELQDKTSVIKNAYNAAYKKNQNFFTKYLSANGISSQDVSEMDFYEKVLKDGALMLKIAAETPSVLRYVDSELLNSENFISELLKKNPEASLQVIALVGEDLKKDRLFVSRLLNGNLSLGYKAWENALNESIALMDSDKSKPGAFAAGQRALQDSLKTYIGLVNKKASEEGLVTSDIQHLLHFVTYSYIDLLSNSIQSVNAIRPIEKDKFLDRIFKNVSADVEKAGVPFNQILKDYKKS